MIYKEELLNLVPLYGVPGFEIDPMVCPKCGGVVKVVAFIEPPQAEVIEKILKHYYGLWKEPVFRPPPDTDGLVQELEFGFSTKRNAHPEPDQALDLTYMDIDTFLNTF